MAGALSAVKLTLDPDRGLTREQCSSCGDSYVCITGFVLRDDLAHAVHYAALHGHADDHETWIDVTLTAVHSAVG